MTSYDVFRLNRMNVGIAAIDAVMDSGKVADEGMGLAAAWLQLRILRDEFREQVSRACAQWFEVQ
jgi:hypothetical protein